MNRAPDPIFGANSSVVVPGRASNRMETIFLFLSALVRMFVTVKTSQTIFLTSLFCRLLFGFLFGLLQQAPSTVTSSENIFASDSETIADAGSIGWNMRKRIIQVDFVFYIFSATSRSACVAPQTIGEHGPFVSDAIVSSLSLTADIIPLIHRLFSQLLCSKLNYLLL